MSDSLALAASIKSSIGRIAPYLIKDEFTHLYVRLVESELLSMYNKGKLVIMEKLIEEVRNAYNSKSNS